MTEPVPTEANPETAGILSNTAVMAAGTVVSRMSGFVRSALLVAALGAGLHADLFNIANTIPNMLYILLAGGIFNAVLVPQLVRAMQNDADGGDAYTNRVMTLRDPVPRRGDGPAGRGGALGDEPLPRREVRRARSSRPSRSRSSTSPASACRRSSSTGCSCWSGRS